MAPNRIWFPAAPTGVVGASQRSALIIHYTGLLTPPVNNFTSFTRVELRTRLINALENTTYYSGTDFNDSIQDGADEICAFTGCVYKGASIDFIANLSYYDLRTLLPNYVGVIAIFNKVVNRWMMPTTTRKLDEIRPDWEISIGTPEQFTVMNHRYVGIFRKPGTSGYGQMLILYRASCPVIDDTTQIPMPIEYKELVESYAKMDLWEQNQEFSKAEMEIKTYQSQLEKLSDLRVSRESDRIRGLK